VSAQGSEWRRFVASQHAAGRCEFSGLRVTHCVRTLCDCFETLDGALRIERQAGLLDAPKTSEWRRHNCPVCGSGAEGDCICPQTAGGASTRDQAISQAPPTREGPRGRPRPPVDVPAPPLPTTEETP
jgi:hypothetical protein